ncbi:zinc-finger homeodomain protein 1-like [Triticum dicoccoides]|nr:zinc-finger homeodomain protein 1-like [Triticum dicoccoides]
MDFDDHDDGDEEMQMSMPMPVSSSYEPPPPLSTGFGGAGVAPNKPQEPRGQYGGSGGGELGGRAKAPGGGARYRECLKNHAVSIGGHAVDGCGEFIAAGEEGSIDALRCAACNCHRNFHRRESDFPAGGEGSPFSPTAMVPYGGVPHHQFSPYYRTPAGYLHHHQHHMAAAAAAAAAAAGHPRPLALPSTSHSGRDDADELSGMAAGPMSALAPLSSMSLGAGPSGYGSGSGSGKKRFRTKFTQEQKDKMLAFAERVGWRIQKHDEAAVLQFCDEVGVKRHVLKVWMHNNKHTLGKKPPSI